MVSIKVRQLYTQTYAKNCATVADVKEAEKKAYAAVGYKFGFKTLEELKAFHQANAEV